MDLTSAIARIDKSFSKLNTAYGREVFDELAIVSLVDDKPALLHYQGPREDNFLADFAEDSIALRKESIESGPYQGGEFNFTRDGDGFGLDAFICLGAKTFLACNNTAKSMKEISQDPAWLDSQGEFLNASQHFAVDPLTV